MSSLRKKGPASLGVTDHVAPNSPATKSDQGGVGGGVRLDVGLEDLVLEDSPESTIYGTPRRARNGRTRSASSPKQCGDEDQSDVPFQLGDVPGDEGIFSSPKAAQPYSSAAALPTVFSSTMQGVIPSMQPIAMLRNRSTNFGTRSQVGGVDAQAFYPATACVFVANLPDHVRDSRLEAELTRVFSQYGIVFVKIRRDSRNMPFAFCQYTKDEDARKAVVQGRGALVEGRPCRTEMVKANRSFIIYQANGGEVNVEDARMQMGGFGEIDKCDALPAEIQEAVRIKGGVLVEYASFDPARDVISAYRHHPTYRVTAYDLKKSMKSKMDPDELWLKQYEIDRRSVFVGNLPVNEPKVQELLTKLAEEVGDVLNVKVVCKDPQPGRPYQIAFGFVEFSRVDMADAAVNRMGGQNLGGSLLRVERKNSREPQSARRGGGEPAFSKYINVPDSPLVNKRAEVQKQQVTEPATPTPSRVPRQRAPSANGNGAMSPENVRATRPMPYGHMPPMGQNYSSPPYGQFHGTPQVGTGNYPATPQATPAMMSPLGSYYATPISWMTPYLQDPSFASMPYYEQYVPHPAHNSPLAGEGVDAREEAKYGSGTYEHRRSGSGRGQ
ncbi:uncharacterized protein GGS22DRAFT_179088 [Annulohypoxylon maeteangense]|uniref:uncharacterized protein n=1 Tax=Annulohypoxylon maeteangense TaxID=1927788 RepID=UPI002008AE12|nr:uncharacterized protein GGS22DRAFT_179088 [Annulohypoxylon maeteangense]KAI0886083.1 hypothetical protein GGS22DRAFT_179088 [Annulohypoxylon maeteangense]